LQATFKHYFTRLKTLFCTDSHSAAQSYILHGRTNQGSKGVNRIQEKTVRTAHRAQLFFRGGGMDIK